MNAFSFMEGPRQEPLIKDCWTSYGTKQAMKWVWYGVELLPLLSEITYYGPV
jgi:hypothetical protein